MTFQRSDAFRTVADIPMTGTAMVATLRERLWTPDAVLAAVFVPADANREQLQRDLAAAFGDVPVIGCTAAATLGPMGYAGGGLGGFILGGADMVTVSRRIDALDSFSMKEGYDAAAALMWDLHKQAPRADHTNTFAFLMIDGLSRAEERVAGAIAQALGAIPLFGGSAADNLQFRDTAVFHEGRFHTGAALLTLVHTRRPFRVFSAQHYQATDAMMVVTSADCDRRVVHQFNGRPAAAEYARLLGVTMAELTPHLLASKPLTVRIGGRNHARGIEKVHADGSMTFGCAIDTGLVLSIARATNPLHILESLFTRLTGEIGPIELTCACDCAVRLLDIRRTGVEAAVGALFGAHSVAGFASFGEQINAMHVNQTFTGVAIGRLVPDRVTLAGAPLPGGNLVTVEPSAAVVPDGAASPVPWAAGAERDPDRLAGMVAALVDRAERSASVGGDTFTLFQNAIALEDTVKRRTAELLAANQRLSRELNERKDMEEALRVAKRQAEQANHMKSQFLAAIGHDLQQPLNAARLFVGTLGEMVRPDDDLAVIDRISESLASVDDLLSSLLDLTSLDSGVVSAHLRDVALGPLLRQLHAEYTPQARMHGLDLRTPVRDLTVNTDPALLLRVLRNFLSNALRYTEEGRVLMGCRRAGNSVWIKVWDTGPGIPPDRLHEIFREFHRLDRPSAVAGGRGLGLGLAIVERIAAILGTEIEVRSQPGKGSVFGVRVPLGTSAGEGARTEAPRDDAALDSLLRGRRILVLDDDPGILDGMRLLLSAWDCRVACASSFAQAIRDAASAPYKPDLIIADFDIGDDLNGIDAVEAIRARLKSPIPAVIITAERDTRITHLAGMRGLGLLQKPVRPSALRALMGLLMAPARFAPAQAAP
ncbi:NahK/ErcS family hybrid sensor histidine kinase/response regulator [Novispirillum sp. DQ9]|uniref:NahK/ErcS family hybrid sensor histidine kinase/response regulator n=1 Tax=Novispirillum sp. DQ9 TaxID=3398612 RepID=UPI003C7E4C00